MNGDAYRRLEPLRLVQAVNDETVSSFEYRAIFGAVPAIVIFVAFAAMGLNLILDLFISIVVWIIVGRLPNEQQLLWLASESGNASKSRSFALSRLLDPADTYKIVRAGAIQAGYYVVSQDDCQERRDKIQREKERQRAEYGSTSALLLDPAEGRPMHIDSGSTGIGTPQNVTQTSVARDTITPPMVDFLPVITVSQRADGLVVLGVAGNENTEDPVRDDDKFYRLREEEVLRPQPLRDPNASAALTNLNKEAANALTDLMVYLTKRAREDQLVAALLGKKHTDQAILHALRSALAVGLVKRYRKPQNILSSRLPEVIDTVRRSAANRRGHEKCFISRTRLGEMWTNPPAAGELRANTIIILGELKYNTSKDDEMVEVLRRVIGLLEKLEDHIGEADDPTSVMAAIQAIRSAKSQSTPQRSSVKKAARTILNVGGQLIIGAAGNEL